MAFDLDDDELRATRKDKGLDYEIKDKVASEYDITFCSNKNCKQKCKRNQINDNNNTTCHGRRLS